MNENLDSFNMQCASGELFRQIETIDQTFHSAYFLISERSDFKCLERN